MVTLTPFGATFSLSMTLRDWQSSLPIQAATALEAVFANVPDSVLIGKHLEVPADTLTHWGSVAAEQLGLPAPCPLAVDLRLNGVMGKPGAQITVRWLQPGKTLPARDVGVDGPWLNYQGKTYRLQAPLFQILEKVDAFNAQESHAMSDHFRHWAALHELLGKRHEQLTDGYLRFLRIVTASALSFSITTDAQGEIQLDPVLLMQGSSGAADSPPHQRALTPSDEALFAQRLDDLSPGLSAFPLSGGTYVVVDEPLQKTLSALRELRQAPPAQRRRAALQPAAVFRELLNQDEGTPTVFVETEKYSERVREIAEWVEPVLPWIKMQTQEWGGPKVPGITLGDVELPLSPEKIETAVSGMTKALADGQPTIDIDGQAVPATSANLDVLKRLQKALRSKTPPDVDGEQAVKVVHNTLRIADNFNETDFELASRQQRPGQIGLPHGLNKLPKTHQTFGLTWLQKHWVTGSRGALLCDDMGLGKTFQALGFCVWLRELMDEGLIPHKPLLIVAPVGLLANWEQEIEQHLMPPFLGDVLRAYGGHIKLLKRGRHLDGTASLDTTRLSGADVVLANYEAVSDYQLSFGAVPFAAVVLDEAQKIKSPKTQVTHAIKALNTDFMLAMTGTPIENRFADLWCIADAVQPGELGDLRSFSARYEASDEHVGALRTSIWQEEATIAGAPKLLLRRLKRDKLDGLPEQHVHVMPVEMPARQLAVYQRALTLQDIAGPSGTLGMIHALRRASLHPLLVEGGVSNESLAIEDSARFIAMFEALDTIAQRQEKVLVFVESLDLQDVEQLPLLIMRRYGLANPPMVINGTVDTKARQERVNRFQRELGFDVMLLSPKAGGVGLTLTAANHVIHLSRWWNPAVEDQCSDRVYRIGQEKPVHIYYPLAVLPGAHEQSFDMKLQNLMDRKRQLAQDLLVAPAFTAEDYEQLVG